MFSGKHFLNIIILLGALQGFIVSALLYFPFKKKKGNRILAILIFLIALASLNLFLVNEQLGGSSKILIFIMDFVPLVIIMPIGPLIYFYVKSSLDPEFTFSKTDRFHFYPIIIDFVPQLTALIYVAGVIARLIKINNAYWGDFVDTYNVYADIPRWVSVTIYLWLSIRYISQRRKNRGASEQVLILKWLKQFISVFLIFQGIWFVFLVPYIIPKYTQALLDWVDWYPLYIPLAIMIYWLGINGLMNTQRPGRFIRFENIPKPVVKDVTTILLASMEVDRLYLIPSLNIKGLSQHTGLAPKLISKILNQHMKQSFNEFVNHYRVEAFKEKVRQDNLDHLTIAGVAFECGFNSLATFQRTFKQITGCSPSEFRKLAVEVQ